jgi:uncharacterized cupredoxin-like copper-binding protein
VAVGANGGGHAFCSSGDRRRGGGRSRRLIYTRKVQVVQTRDGKPTTLAEFKGAIREIEVYPGHSAEWWFVPVATGRVTDLRCGIVKDGKSHADLGMVGEIVIE